MVVLAGMLMACGLGYSQNNNKIGKRIDGELIDAVSALDEGQYKEAQVTLERILTADPRNDAAQYYLGMCRLYATTWTALRRLSRRPRSWIRPTSGTRKGSHGHIH